MTHYSKFSEAYKKTNRLFKNTTYSSFIKSNC